MSTVHEKISGLSPAVDVKTAKDFCQDPETGLLCGSEPGAGGDESGKQTGGKPGGGKGSAKLESLSEFRKDKVSVSVTGGQNEQEFLDTWNSMMGMSPAEFKKDFMGGADGEMKLSLTGAGVGATERYMHITGKIKDGGKTVGTFHRTIDVQKKSAVSEKFEMQKEAQGKDFGKKLLAGNIAMYREMNLKHVDTFANIDVGGYAWAKYGYVPTRSAWSGLKEAINHSISISAPDVQARAKNEIGAILKSADPRAIWALADSPWGKTLLLGRSWEGRLDLKDKDSMARFDAYVNKKKSAKAFAGAKRQAPKGSKDPKSQEFFYIDDDGTAQDADLHNDILDNGDDAAAKKISDKILNEILGEEKAMPISPGKDETQSEWMARCTPDMMGQNGGTKRPQEQAVAACIQMWKDKNKTANGTVRKQADDMEVEDGESHQDFMDRCTEELDEMECQLIWSERSNREVVHKTSTAPVVGKEFVLSDESQDRMGDVIVSEGWKLDSFKKNPVALFNHDSSFIVGRWDKLSIDKTAKTLRGHLELAPAGISPRIDEIRALVEAGILKAVSVGFKPLKHEPLDPQKPFGGYRFLEHELVETSLVAVPANANALAVAKSLNISQSTMDLVFSAKPGRSEEARTREFSRRARHKQQGGQRSGQMSLTQRIQDCEAKLAEQKAALADHWANVDDDNVTDKELETASTLKDSINLLEKKREQLIASEKILGETSADNNNGRGGNGVTRGGALTVYHAPANNGRGDEMAAPAVIKRPVKKELEPMDYFVRAALVGYASKVWQRSPEEARLMIAKHRPEFDDEAHKTMCDIILRAATAPAMTTVTGWAAELVQQIWAAPMETLFPDAIYTKLAARGLSLSFGRAGKINIPTRSRTPTIAGSFVGEGAAIPVRQGAFTSQTLTPRKVAVITVWTREMNEHSTPAIEGLLRDAIQQDTSIAIDSVLIDNGAATAVRPAGLLNGVTTTGASAAATSFDKILADIKNLSGQLIANTFGNIRSPVWLLNPREENLAKFAVAPQTGVFPWKAELQAGNLNGWPTIVSGTVPLGTIILIDTADFVSVGGDAPRFELSDQATLHMEDTTPLDLASGSPATVASPQRSLFQTDSIALRMIMDTNWLQRRSGTVAALASVAW